MATVTIGGRELSVPHTTLGVLKKRLIPARRAVAEATTEEASIDALVELILVYVGHNAGVDAEFILDNVPGDPRSLIAACVAASGQQVAPAGEAPRP